MATVSSSACILAFTVLLGISLLGTCMGKKDPVPTTTQRRGWGRGWGRSRSHGEGAGSPQGQGDWPDPAGYNLSRSGCHLSHRNRTSGPNTANWIIVGGSNNWNFGFNYSDWALKNGPYYLNDVLVFKYSAPVNGTPGHSIYLLPNFWSYLNCDFSRVKRVATTSQGGGKGFEFKLTKWQPHYFACGEHKAFTATLVSQPL